MGSRRDLACAGGRAANAVRRDPAHAHNGFARSQAHPPCFANKLSLGDGFAEIHLQGCMMWLHLERSPRNPPSPGGCVMPASLEPSQPIHPEKRSHITKA